MNEFIELQTKLEKKYSDDLVNVSRAKSNQMFQLAWDYGHSGGDDEVENHYRDFVNLLK